MAYCDNLYNIGNIIGYTGQLHDFPTVYFKCDQQDIVGHITQRHEYPQNIGRQEPMPLGGIPYSIRNVVNSKGELVAKEYYGNYAFHTSRGTFTALGTAIRPGQGPMLDMAVVNILAQAIRNNPNEKQLSAIGDHDERAIKATMETKNKMLSQLTQLNSAAKRGHAALQKRGLA